nr:hypothetical protein [Tanacetum cinerariifolium]
MATTIEQQTVLDESLVPSSQRLRIGRSNLRLPSDIQSKEATLQVVYDVLRNSPLFRAFQVTADVPEIYMQEFWATVKLHHTSIRFKIDTKKSVLNLEAFREILHISPRIPNQSFADLPTEEEVLDFLRFLGHSQDIRYLTDVNVNKLYQPWRSFASVINKCLTGKSSGVDSFRLSQAQMLWGLYYRINIDFVYLIWEDFIATTPVEPTDLQRTEAEKIKIVLKRSRRETHISQQSGSGTCEGTGSKPGVPDVPSDDSEEELSWKSSDDEEVSSQEEGNESNDDSDDGEEETAKDDEELKETGTGGDEVRESGASQVVSLEPPTPIMTPSTIATITTSGEAPIPPPTIPSIILENLPTFNSAFRFEERLRLLETSFYEYRQTNQVADAVSAIPGIVHQYMDQQMKAAVREADEVLTRSSHSSRTSYDVAADLSEMELKKILIEKIEGNKSI